MQQLAFSTKLFQLLERCTQSRCREPSLTFLAGNPERHKTAKDLCETPLPLSLMFYKKVGLEAVVVKASGIITCANEEKPNRIWSCGALAIGIAFPIIAAIRLSRATLLAVLLLRKVPLTRLGTPTSFAPMFYYSQTRQ